MKKSKFIFLSYPLSEKTPSYRGLHKVRLAPGNVIKKKGEPCSTEIGLNSHLGTHIDFPRHFIRLGKSGDQYDAGRFIFHSVQVVAVPAGIEMIGPQDLAVKGADPSVEILLIKTGMGRSRAFSSYWKEYPGIHHRCAGFLQKTFPGLRAIGLDSISISSLRDRMEGRRAHREFLRRGIWIIEDMDLTQISVKSRFQQITAGPLLFTGCDAAPCTVVAEVKGG